MTIFAKAFNIQWAELKILECIVVNENKMKLPIFQDDPSRSIAYKFLLNPTKIDNLDDLYDAFELNKGTNVKYLIISNPSKNQSVQTFTL